MTPERWHQVTEIFHAAVARSAADRAALIGERCGDDLALRHDVDSLLAAHEQASALGPSAAVVPPPLAPGSAFGMYRVAALLGAGGMGEVYRAWDPQLARDVAIKVLPPQFTSDPDRLARFAREARALASLNHPHIGAIYGVEEHGGVRGLVLELVEGPTLADRIASGPLGMDEALRMAGHIAEALEAAHDKGIVHRDLKPANIKITPAGVVKVLDFGLARPGGDSSIAMTGGLSSEGLIVGTPGYMSPEQARGRPVDKRSDIWAFGCVVYEMLTGRSAFSGETVSDTIANVLEREPDLSRVPARVPAAVHYVAAALPAKESRRPPARYRRRANRDRGRSHGAHTLRIRASGRWTRAPPVDWPGARACRDWSEWLAVRGFARATAGLNGPRSILDRAPRQRRVRSCGFS